MKPKHVIAIILGYVAMMIIGLIVSIDALNIIVNLIWWVSFSYNTCCAIDSLYISSNLPAVIKVDWGNHE